MNVIKFVILAAPRTGSNLLCTLLNSHPRILCHHEVFNPEGIYLALDLRDGAINLGTMAERDRDPIGFLERVWRMEHVSKSDCVGFKWTQMENASVLRHILRDREIRKIVLRRRNRVKTFVSELIALQTGQWEVYDRDELVRQRPRVRLELSDLQRHVARNEEYYGSIQATLTSSDQLPLTVDYEDLFNATTHARLLEFLEVDPGVLLQAGSVKQNPADPGELIENYSEFAAIADASEFAAELHDTGQ